MQIKSMLLLITFLCTNVLIGMKNQTWTLQKTFEHHNWVNPICFNKAKKLLGFSSCNTCAYIIDFESNKKAIFYDFRHGVISLCFNKKGNKFAALTTEPRTHIFDIIKNENDKLICKKIDSFAHKGVITSIYFDGDNVLGLKSDEKNFKVHITDLETNKDISSFKHNHWVTTTTISPSKNLLATGSGNNKARLFDIKSKKELSSFELKSPVKTFAFNYDETLLAVASHDKMIRFFDLTTYKEIDSLLYDQTVLSMCFGQDALIIGSIDGKIRIFTHAPHEQ